jgi:ribosome-associated protein YbcJ (S4-like RNA binding protein)
MKKKLLGLAMAVATFGLVAQGGTAKAFLLNDRSPNVTVGQFIAGGSMAAVYWTQICHNGFHNCANFTSAHALKWYGLTTVGCMALSPIIGGLLVSANEKRELRSSEVYMMTADCILPIIGGWIMKSAFDAHPEWDAGTGHARH